MEPDISVILCAHNAGNMVGTAIASILIQSHSNFELIVVDDGSTDETLQVINKFKNDPRLKIISRPNKGLTVSLNEAIAIAKGRWIARQDADDISLATRLEKQLAFLEKHPETRLLGTSTFVSNSRGIYNEILRYPDNETDIINALVHLNPFVHGSIMIDHKLISETGGYNPEFRYAQDYEYWCRLLPGIHCANMTDPLYARLRLDNSSEVSVDKTPIVKKIIAGYIDRNQNIATNGSFVSIKSIDVDLFGFKTDYFVYLLGKTFKLISKKLRNQNLPWKNIFLQSLLYRSWRSNRI